VGHEISVHSVFYSFPDPFNYSLCPSANFLCGDLQKLDRQVSQSADCSGDAFVRVPLSKPTFVYWHLSSLRPHRCRESRRAFPDQAGKPQERHQSPKGSAPFAASAPAPIDAREHGRSSLATQCLAVG